jgi:hypothetical protein
VDIPVTKVIAIGPAQCDFVLTKLGNTFTYGNNNQSNFATMPASFPGSSKDKPLLDSRRGTAGEDSGADAVPFS